MITGQHYQNAYITRNIDKAIEHFRGSVDSDKIAVYEIPVELTTPRGRGIAVSKLAFIWVNNLQYELIEPVSGMVDIYTEQLPDDDSLKLHHTCMRVADWDQFRSWVLEQDYPVVLEGGSEHLKFLYLDARPHLGHYLEYVWMTDERWKQMGGA